MQEFIKLNNFLSCFQKFVEEHVWWRVDPVINGERSHGAQEEACMFCSKIKKKLCSDLLLLMSECIEGSGQYNRCKPKTWELHAWRRSLVAVVRMLNAINTCYGMIIIIIRGNPRWNMIVELVRGLYTSVAVWSWTNNSQGWCLPGTDTCTSEEQRISQAQTPAPVGHR